MAVFILLNGGRGASDYTADDVERSPDSESAGSIIGASNRLASILLEDPVKESGAQ